jgi:hypothetical protein
MAEDSTTKRRAKSGTTERRAKKKKAHVRPESLTLSVPEAGRKYYGLSRTGSYDAADRGEIPTIKIGKLRRVPIRAMEQKLDEATA